MTLVALLGRVRSDEEIGSMKRTRAEVAEYIERCVDGSGGKWDWDDFTSSGSPIQGLTESAWKR